MVIIDVTIVDVALPSMAIVRRRYLMVAMGIDGYTLTFACLLLLQGNVGDRLGANLLSYGINFVVLSSIWLRFALILGMNRIRLLQVATAALLVPYSLALSNASYSNPEEPAKAIGIWAAMVECCSGRAHFRWSS